MTISKSNIEVSILGSDVSVSQTRAEVSVTQSIKIFQLYLLSRIYTVPLNAITTQSLISAI